MSSVTNELLCVTTRWEDIRRGLWRAEAGLEDLR